MKCSAQHDEGARLEALAAYGILDTPPETGFEHITSLVIRLFNVPIAAVTLVDAERQWFKSIRGLNVRETPRDASFCTHAMWGDDVMVVPDAARDPRFAANPLVIGEPKIRFYAGAPLRTPEGYPLGALCVIGLQPRDLSLAERRMLTDLASLVEDELLLHRVGKELREENARYRLPAEAVDENIPASRPGTIGQSVIPSADRVLEDRFREIVDQEQDAIFVYDLTGRLVDVNTTACALVGYAREELLRLRMSDIELTFDPVKGPERWREMAVGTVVTMEGINHRKDGHVFPSEARISVVETRQGRFLLALVRDISDRKQAERLLRERVHQQQVVAKLGTAALRGGEIDVLLDETVRMVGETLGVEICRVLEHVPDRQELITRAGLNLDLGEVGKKAASDSLKYAAGHVLRTGEPIIIKNVRDDQRFEITPWLKQSGAVSGLCVSVGGDATHMAQYGILAVYSREQRNFTEDDVYFVQSAANVLAAAIVRHRAEDALRAVEARYQRIAVNTPGVVYQYLHVPDGTLEIPFISEGCRVLYGREPREIQENPELMVNAIHPEEREGMKEAVQTAKVTLTHLHWQGRLIQPNGDIRWVRFDSRPEQLPDGGVMCDGIIIDVTEEEERKEALRQSEERFRRAIVHSPFPVMLYADDGEVLQVNNAWTHLTGYLPDELNNIEDWLQRAYPTEELRQEIRRIVVDIYEHASAVSHPARRIRCSDGEERIWDFSSANLGRLPDERRLYITTAIDVTERHRSEAALRLAKEEAERANLAKSVFLSRMSHELRTPLNAILGFGQLLEMNNLDSQDMQSVAHILKGGRHLLALVDDVLDLARVEAGEISLALTPVSYDKLAQECAGFVARLAKAREIHCTVAVTSECRISVRADEQRLRQVLLNLLSNAIKYNREGGDVSLSCEERPHGRVRLKVTDTGAGITPEGLARLFVPFERLGQEFGEVEGAGLGLVVSKQLVEAMGGTMGAESQVDRGSTFWVELAVTANPSGQETADSKPGGPSDVTRGQEPPATLLYIEDNASNMQVIKSIVERLRPHWRFLSAQDGQRGLQEAHEHVPDVILLDLQLPGMNGDAVLSELRKDPKTAMIPVLLLSADATTHSRERLLALGANDYLSKPFNVANLLEKLDALLLVAGQ